MNKEELLHASLTIFLIWAMLTFIPAWAGHCDEGEMSRFRWMIGGELACYLQEPVK